MYIEKTMSINGVVLEDYPFNKEVFLEGFLLEHLNHICPPGYEASGVDPVNQIPVHGGGQDGSDGRIDIAFELAAESNNPWALAEIENVRLDIPHLNQLLAYLSQQQQLISEIQKRLGKNVSPGRWIGILVGPSIDASLGAALVNNAWQELPGINHNLKDVEIGAVVVNRYREKANNAIYVFADKYFPIRSSSSGRDYSKFSFDDRQHWYRSGSGCLNNFPRFISGHRAGCRRCRVVHGVGRRLRRTDRRGGQLGAHPGVHVTRPALVAATPPDIFPPA